VRSAAKNGSGASWNGKWPAPGMETNRAPGMAAAKGSAVSAAGEAVAVLDRVEHLVARVDDRLDDAALERAGAGAAGRPHPSITSKWTSRVVASTRSWKRSTPSVPRPRVTNGS
jgi:hypothetical protein